MYQCSQDGQAGTSFTIPNAGGASPDLRTDALAGMTFSRPAAGGISLLRLMRANLDGYGPVAPGTLDGGMAQALLFGRDPTNAVITNPLIYYARTVISMFDMATGAVLSVDTDVDAFPSGNPILIVRSFGPGGSIGGAYIDIQLVQR